MKLSELNEWLSLTANLGVIVGIIFLAIELRQNNVLLQNEARYNLHLSRSSELEELSQNPELLDLLGKAGQEQDLTEREQRLLGNMLLSRFIHWEWYYEQYLAGLVEFDNLPVNAWKNILSSNTNIEVWQQRSNLLSQDFVDWMNANVVPQY